MDIYQIDQIGSRDFKPLLVKPVLCGALGMAAVKVRGYDVSKEIEVMGKSMPFGAVHALGLGTASLISETLSQYVFPGMDSIDKIAAGVGAAFLSSALVAGGNVLTHSLAHPELVGSNDGQISVLELLIEGATVELLSQSIYERYVGPLLTLPQAM